MKSMDAYQNYTWLSTRISYLHEKRHYTFKTNRVSEHYRKMGPTFLTPFYFLKY